MEVAEVIAVAAFASARIAAENAVAACDLDCCSAFVVVVAVVEVLLDRRHLAKMLVGVGVAPAVCVSLDLAAVPVAACSRWVMMSQT